MSAATGFRAAARLAALVAVVASLTATAQRPPNENYQPPVKGQALFDPRPAKRAEAEAEAARKAAEEQAAREAVQVKVDASADPARRSAAEPAVPAPEAAPQALSETAAEPAAEPASAPVDVDVDVDVAVPSAAATALPTAEGHVASSDAVAVVTEVIQTPVENPRPYGYLVGDLLVQKVQLSVDGQSVDLVEIPRKDRFGSWISRRGARVERRPDGTRWLVLDYQIVNASKDVDVITLPKLHLRTTTPDVFIDVADWPITVGAITASLVRNQGGLIPLQPDRPAPTIATDAIRRALMASLAGLALTVALWLGWWRWREWQASERLPFARAAKVLRSVDGQSEAAWKALHQAFDATAGRVIQPASLSLLFRAAPQLEAARDRIERFYAASAERFFGGHEAAPAGVSIPELAAELRRIERQHER